MAEITQQDDFGVAMGKCINRYAIRKILEIGAFDGDESTQVLAKALAEKKGEKSLVSLEEKSERFKNLVANTRVYPSSELCRHPPWAVISLAHEILKKTFGVAPSTAFVTPKSRWRDGMQKIWYVSNNFPAVFWKIRQRIGTRY